MFECVVGYCWELWAFLICSRCEFLIRCVQCFFALWLLDSLSSAFWGKHWRIAVFSLICSSGVIRNLWTPPRSTHTDTHTPKDSFFCFYRCNLQSNNFIIYDTVSAVYIFSNMVSVEMLGKPMCIPTCKHNRSRHWKLIDFEKLCTSLFQHQLLGKCFLHWVAFVPLTEMSALGTCPTLSAQLILWWIDSDTILFIDYTSITSLEMKCCLYLFKVGLIFFCVICIWNFRTKLSISIKENLGIL